LFEGGVYRHRDSSLGDSVAICLPEDLYALQKSSLFNGRVDAGERVVNTGNRLHGIQARRGDGTFGELVPLGQVVDAPGFVVKRGPIATVEIGTEVKILANSMIKQIDRVINDLINQVSQFKAAGGTPISVGIVGINQADRYTSYEADRAWPTGTRGKKHPFQEAGDAERRVLSQAASWFDEFLILRFKAQNEPPYDFQWVNETRTTQDYASALTRIIRKYEARF
jgi:hypothetical protein